MMAMKRGMKVAVNELNVKLENQKIRKQLRKRRKIKTFDIVAVAILIMIGLVVLFPFYNVVIISFAKYASIAKAKLYILPTSFQLKAYKSLVEDSEFWRAFGNTVFITVAGVTLSMIVSVAGSYALSVKSLPFRNFFLTLILITMFFGGGLIPYYLLMKNLHLIDSIFVMVIPTCVSTTYIIIMKNYFVNMPISLIESARLDGANDITILLKIILPISKPFMATFALFYAVERWNEWWNAQMFISKSSLAPLQIYLRNLLIAYNSTISSNALAQAERNIDNTIYFPSLQMAAVVVSSIPILMVYPYLQKHFTKGILVGSVKE